MSPTFRCGHPRVPENTIQRTNGRNGECLTCQRERQRELRGGLKRGPMGPRERPEPPHRKQPMPKLSANREYRDRYQAAPVLPPRQKLDLSDDPDVLRYRAERDKRAERKQPEMDAARTAFYTMLETEKAKGRGGRPRKPQPTPKSWEIVI